MASRLVPLVILASFLPFLPLVEAQETVSANVGVSIPDPGTPVVPGRIHVYTYRVVYKWGAGAVSEDPIELKVSLVESADWANVTFQPSSWTVDLSPGTQAGRGFMNGSATFEGTLNVTAGDRAPAFQRQNITLQVEASGGGNVAEPRPQTSTLPIQPDFLGSLAVSGGPVLLRGGREQEIPVTVTNHGNGPVDVTFQTTSLLAQSKVTPPPPIRLGGPLGPEPESATVWLRVAVPWTQSLNGSITLTATGISAQNTQKAPVIQDLEIPVRSASVLPGAGPVLSVPALALLAWALGRRV